MAIRISTMERVIFTGNPPGVDPSQDLRASDNPQVPAIYSLEPGTPPGSRLIATWYTPIGTLINIKGFAKISPQLVPDATDPTDVDIQLALAADASEVSNVTMRIRIYTLYDGDAPPELFVSPTALTLVTAPASSGNSQPVTLTNRGGGMLTWSAGPASQSWMTITPTSGSISAGASSSLTVAVDATGLAPGTYSATIPITPSVGPTITLSVTLNNLPPELVVSPNPLTISTFVGGNPPLLALTLTNSGNSILTWSAGPASQPWLTIIPTSGNISAGASSSLTVAVDVTGLAPGTYAEVLPITPSLGATTTLNVFLTILP